MDFSDEVTKKRAMRVLAIVVVIIIIVLIISTVTKFFLIPSLIGTILVVCVIAYVAHRIYVSKRQSETEEEEAERMMRLFNGHHKNLNFTREYEENGKINFLDLRISRRKDELEFDIYRKPMQTDSTVNKKSIHPTSHKTAAFGSMLYRAFKIPLNEDNRRREITTMKAIARANGFNL